MVLGRDRPLRGDQLMFKFLQGCFVENRSNLFCGVQKAAGVKTVEAEVTRASTVAWSSRP